MTVEQLESKDSLTLDSGVMSDGFLRKGELFVRVDCPYSEDCASALSSASGCGYVTASLVRVSTIKTSKNAFDTSPVESELRHKGGFCTAAAEVVARHILVSDLPTAA